MDGNDLDTVSVIVDMDEWESLMMIWCMWEPLEERYVT